MSCVDSCLPANMTQLLSETSPCLAFNANRFIPGWNPLWTPHQCGFKFQSFFLQQISPTKYQTGNFFLSFFVALNRIKTFAAAAAVHISVALLLCDRSAATRLHNLPVADVICLPVNSVFYFFLPGQCAGSLIQSFHQLHSFPLKFLKSTQHMVWYSCLHEKDGNKTFQTGGRNNTDWQK